jgi:hypothetical protein
MPNPEQLGPNPEEQRIETQPQKEGNLAKILKMAGVAAAVISWIGGPARAETLSPIEQENAQQSRLVRAWDKIVRILRPSAIQKIENPDGTTIEKIDETIDPQMTLAQFNEPPAPDDTRTVQERIQATREELVAELTNGGLQEATVNQVVQKWEQGDLTSIFTLSDGTPVFVMKDVVATAIMKPTEEHGDQIGLTPEQARQVADEEAEATIKVVDAALDELGKTPSQNPAQTPETPPPTQ